MCVHTRVLTGARGRVPYGGACGLMRSHVDTRAIRVHVFRDGHVSPSNFSSPQPL